MNDKLSFRDLNLHPVVDYTLKVYCQIADVTRIELILRVFCSLSDMTNHIYSS